VSVLEIVLIVIGVVLVILIVGGLIANARRTREGEGALRAELEQANRALAIAHAQDKGWEREALERAAREAFAQRSDATVRELELVQVIDRPGIDEDQAVFRVITDAGNESLRLDRHEGGWAAR